MVGTGSGPDLRLDARLVSVAHCHLERWGQQVRAQAVSVFIHCPAWPARGNFEDHPVRIVEIDRFEVKPVVGASDRQSQVGQAALPGQQAGKIRHLQGQVMRSADAGAAFGEALPLEESDGGARASGAVAKIEVIRAGIVEIDGFFDQTQSQNARVKVERALGVGGYQGNMV